MVCENCGRRMRCGYSVPAQERVRYRVYKCVCGTYTETMETPVGAWGKGEVGDLVGAAQRQRMGFIWRRGERGKAGTGHA